MPMRNNYLDVFYLLLRYPLSDNMHVEKIEWLRLLDMNSHSMLIITISLTTL